MLDYKGIRRELMQPHRWTQLFFLDEAAALSAGHRPCAECRRTDYDRFRSLWENAFGSPAGADAMDRVLHEQRVGKLRLKRTYREDLAALPDATFVAIDGAAYLVLGSQLLRWTDSGYAQGRPRPAQGEVDVLTPRSIVAILSGGYAPLLHPSATP